MLRRAEWRSLPDDPKTPLTWWWRDLPRSPSEGRPSLFFVGLPVLAMFAVAANHLWPIYLVAMLYAAFGLRMRKIRRDVQQRIAALGPVPTVESSMAVHCQFFDGDTCTGRDQGTITIVDGWLYFEGLRSTFSLRPVDISRAKPRSLSETVFGLPNDRTLRISASRYVERYKVREVLSEWRTFPHLFPSGEPVLPPIDVHPTARTKPVTNFGLSFFLLGWVMLMMIAPLRVSADALCRFVLLIGGGIALRDLIRSARELVDIRFLELRDRSDRAIEGHVKVLGREVH